MTAYLNISRPEKNIGKSDTKKFLPGVKLALEP